MSLRRGLVGRQRHRDGEFWGFDQHQGLHGTGVGDVCLSLGDSFEHIGRRVDYEFKDDLALGDLGRTLFTTNRLDDEVGGVVDTIGLSGLTEFGQRWPRRQVYRVVVSPAPHFVGDEGQDGGQ